MHNLFRLIRRIARYPRYWYLAKVWGYRLAPSAFVSMGATLDRSNPAGVSVGAHSIVTRGATVLAHDYVRGLRCDTHIGENCFIGVGAIIMPGVRIGDGSIVGAGAVVVNDVASGSLVVGNPARVIRTVAVGHYGRLLAPGEESPA